MTTRKRLKVDCPLCGVALCVNDDGDGVSVTCPSPTCMFCDLTYTQCRFCGDDGTTGERNANLRDILAFIKTGRRRLIKPKSKKEKSTCTS